jgi:sugar transferase (PEP-CTERM/EpsH1 system associated)
LLHGSHNELQMSAIAQLPTSIYPRAGAPLRVLHVIPQLGIGGTENGVLNIMEYFGNEIEQSICAMRRCDATSPRIVALGDKVSVIGSRKFAINQLAERFRRLKPDVVHSRNWGAIESVLAARLAGVPGVIHSEHGYELGMENGLPLRQRAFRALSYRAAGAVVTVSEELRKFHSAQAWISPRKMRVIPNGVNTKRYKPDAQARAAIRKELAIEPNAIVVSTIGRLIALKDHRSFINAMRTVTESVPGVIGMIVGDGPERENLSRQIAESGLERKVIMAGERQDVNALLAASDLFCLPSKLEGMSNTILEAMAAGLPTIATFVGANPELVVEGETGALVPVGDTTALAKTISDFVSAPGLLARAGAMARERVLKNFSLDLMMHRYRELYMQCGARKVSA